MGGAAAVARAHREAADEAGACFVLAGAIDGMTDELVIAEEAAAAEAEAAEEPGAAAGGVGAEEEDGGGGEGWTLQPVLVEVKHRVGSIKTPPPFYDVLQATTYCLMLGVEAADLVQCLRASSSESTIHVTRIPLHGPPLHHGPAWWSHVLPRLYAFARAVHAFRGSSALRYAYLLGGDEARDALLARHLPHLPFRLRTE